MNKKYKAGQLVTISNRVFRIVRKSYGFNTCRICKDTNGDNLCNEWDRNPEIRKIFIFCYNLPYGHYLKRVL